MNVSPDDFSPQVLSKQPLIMGVVNLTPDSFSDGGAFVDPGAACAQAQRLVEDGADIIDLGAESTRPGATPVPTTEEWQRLAPVLRRLCTMRLGAAISVDTRKPELMLRAAEWGATWVNDVGGTAPVATLAALAGRGNIQYIAMHMMRTPDIMQHSPMPPRASLASVEAFFAERAASAAAAGLAPDYLWVDPGIGFGKTDAANAHLMRAVAGWSRRHQVAIGISRKSFIGRALKLPSPQSRDHASKMLEFGLAMLGAKLIRTHAVASLRPLLNLLKGGVDG